MGDSVGHWFFPNSVASGRGEERTGLKTQNLALQVYPVEIISLFGSFVASEK
jgi:hypothetical protein